MADSTLTQLITMSHELGRPESQLAILGEGNTSALCAGDQFLVKASGSMLSTIEESGFARLDRAATEVLLDSEMNSDAEIMAALLRVCVDNAGRRPSIEAMMHAFLLGLPEVNFVGHTHPIAVNALLCSERAEELAHVCLFPDQIVCCGPAPVFIPYSDPGLPLARLVRERVLAWMQTYQAVPKAILLQNHGVFALGNTAQHVLSCTLMWDKTARVIAGAMACGGVHPLDPDQIERIYTRPDEKFRAQIIGKA
jgi:rhamnose utilization protein RhaD (predicted bifunctional aldolase and dehydrogenase)